MARPVEFEIDTVLSKAMETFWEYGYSATSMSNLVEITGLKPGSIYAAFGSKEGLFLSAIDKYGQRSLDRLRTLIEQADSPLGGIRQYFQRLKDEAIKDPNMRGCFLVNTVLEVAPHNLAVREKVNDYLEQIENSFVEALSNAQKAGELATEKSPKMLAKYLMTNIWGMRVLSRIQKNSDAYDAVMNSILSELEKR